MSDLVVSTSAEPDTDGSVLRVTPESAGWEYVGFDVLRLADGRIVERDTGGEEVCLVVLSGFCTVSTADEEWRGIGNRDSVFEGPPYAVYLPPGTGYRVEAVTYLELGVCSAPAEGGAAQRLIRPEDTQRDTRGTGNMERAITNILMEDQPAERLLVVEVITRTDTGRATRLTSTTRMTPRASGTWRRRTTIASSPSRASRCRGSIPKTARSTRR